jgi:hypothetical protein
MPEAPDQNDSTKKTILEYAPPPPPPSRTGWHIAAFIVFAIPLGAALILVIGFFVGLMVFAGGIHSPPAAIFFFAAGVAASVFSIRKLSRQRRTSLIAGILVASA